MRGDPKKLDHGKLMWDLLPYESVEQIVDILTYGAEKYGAESWKTVKDAKDRYFAALMRHLVEYKKGNILDSESGKSHLAHAATNAIFLLWLEDNEYVSDVYSYTAYGCELCKRTLPLQAGTIIHSNDRLDLFYCDSCYNTYIKDK